MARLATPHPTRRWAWRDALVARLDAIAARLRDARPAAPLVQPDGTGWMPGAIRMPTAKRYHAGYRPSKVRPVEMVAIHYTASPPGDGPDGATLARYERWAADRRRQSSTHFIATRDGQVVQLMPIHDRAWHVTSRWPAPLDGCGDINERAIGVDLGSVGWLTGEPGDLRHAYGGRFDDSRHPIVFKDGQWWEAYRPAQLDAACRIMAYLGAALPHLRDGRPGRVFGHHEAQPTRPDPGPQCPMGRLRAALG